MNSISHESIRHRCKLLAIGTFEILKYKLNFFFFWNVGISMFKIFIQVLEGGYTRYN